MDRSLAFTALLELDPTFGKLNTAEAAQRIDHVLRHHRHLLATTGTTGLWETTKDLLRAEAGAAKTFARVWAGREDWI